MPGRVPGLLGKVPEALGGCWSSWGRCWDTWKRRQGTQGGSGTRSGYPERMPGYQGQALGLQGRMAGLERMPGEDARAARRVLKKMWSTQGRRWHRWGGCWGTQGGPGEDAEVPGADPRPVPGIFGAAGPAAGAPGTLPAPAGRMPGLRLGAIHCGCRKCFGISRLMRTKEINWWFRPNETAVQINSPHQQKQTDSLNESRPLQGGRERGEGARRHHLRGQSPPRPRAAAIAALSGGRSLTPAARSGIKASPRDLHLKGARRGPGLAFSPH